MPAHLSAMERSSWTRVEGRPDQVKMKKKEYDNLDKMPLAAISEADMRWNRTGSWRNIRPYYEPKTSPCIAGCPAREDIQGYIALGRQGKLEEAVRLIWEKNPLPAVCGRVCYHPCVDNCARAEFDEPLFIPAIERFLGDYAIASGLKDRRVAGPKEGRVAVVGGGPAGLSCAYYLARSGYRVTIYEKRDELGGVLRYGIPPYRLPKEVLASEVERILALGIEAKTGTTIGSEVGGEGLDEYAAFFLGVGLQRSRELAIPGENSRGVMSGLEFLSALNSGQKVEVGRRVVVIGGGNTAMDVARSALRLGAEVTVIYRRTEREMPAIRDEVQEAREEGVKFVFLASPVEVEAEGGRLKEVRCQEMKLGEPDESGRRRPIPKEGAFFTVPADTMLVAAGEMPDTEPFSALVELNRGLIVTDDFGRTSNAHVFAGGDVVTGAATVVNAVARGRAAAQLIEAELSGGRFQPEKEKKVVAVADINTAYFVHQRRARMPRVERDKLTASFSEVNLGLSKEQVLSELERCFSCGVCNSCDNCWVFCPDVAISRKDGVYAIDYDYCKGCLICVEECPRACLSTEEEGQ